MNANLNANEWQDRWTLVKAGLERSTLLGKDVLRKMVEAASQDVFQPLSAKIKASLTAGFAHAEVVGDRVVTQVQAFVSPDRFSTDMFSPDMFSQNILSESIQRWLAVHPLWAWSLAHPMFALAIALISLVLLVTGLKWLLNPKTWLKILSFPVRFVARRLTPSPQAKLKVAALDRPDYQPPDYQSPDYQPLDDQASADQIDIQDHQTHIQAILARLQILQQEQATLHQQLQTLLTEAAKSQRLPKAN